MDKIQLSNQSYSICDLLLSLCLMLTLYALNCFEEIWKIYMHFASFLDTETMLVIEILLLQGHNEFLKSNNLSFRSAKTLFTNRYLDL